jgi:hypothetical protein
VVISGLATNQPELLFNGMQGNALDIPGMKQCTPNWAIFPHLFSYSIASSFFSLKLHVHKVHLIHRDAAH